MASTALLDLLGAAGNAFDLPGSMLRDALSLENPLDQLLSPFSGENRVTGRQLNRNLGLAGSEDNWGNFLGGMATETLLDPLNIAALGATLGLKGGVLRGIKGELDKAADLAGPQHTTTLDDLFVSDQVLEDAATRHGRPTTAKEIIGATINSRGDNPYAEETLRRVLREIPPGSELYSKLDDDSLRLLGPTHGELRQSYGMTPEVPAHAPAGEKLMETIGQPEEYRLQYGQPHSLEGVTQVPEGRVATTYEPRGTPQQISDAASSEMTNDDYFKQLMPRASVSQYDELVDPTHWLQFPEERLLPFPDDAYIPQDVGMQPNSEMLRDLTQEAMDAHAHWQQHPPATAAGQGWQPPAPDDWSGDLVQAWRSRLTDPEYRTALEDLVEQPLGDFENLANMPLQAYPQDEFLIDNPHVFIQDFLDTRRVLPALENQMPYADQLSSRWLRYSPERLTDDEAITSMLDSMGRTINDATGLRRVIREAINREDLHHELSDELLEAVGRMPPDDEYFSNLENLQANQNIRQLEAARARGEELITRDELEEILEDLDTEILDDLDWEDMQGLDAGVLEQLVDDAWGDSGTVYEVMDEMAENIDQHIPPGYRYGSQEGGEYGMSPIPDYQQRSYEGYGDEGAGELERLLTDMQRDETNDLPAMSASVQDDLDALTMSPELAEYMAMQPLDVAAPQVARNYTVPELAESLDPLDVIRGDYGRELEAPQRLRAFFGPDHDISQARALPTEMEVIEATQSSAPSNFAMRDWLAENEPMLSRLLKTRDSTDELAREISEFGGSVPSNPLDLSEPQPMLDNLMMSESGISSPMMERFGAPIEQAVMNDADELHPALLGILERMGYLNQNRGLSTAFDLQDLEGDLEKILPYILALNAARNPVARIREQ